MSCRRRTYPQTPVSKWYGETITWLSCKHRSNYLNIQNIYTSTGKSYSNYFSSLGDSNGEYSDGYGLIYVDMIQLGDYLLFYGYVSNGASGGYVRGGLFYIPIEDIMTGKVEYRNIPENKLINYSYYSTSGEWIGMISTSEPYNSSRFVYVEGTSKVAFTSGHSSDLNTYVIDRDLNVSQLSYSFNYGNKYYNFKGSLVRSYNAYSSSYAYSNNYTSGNFTEVYVDFDNVLCTPKYIVGVNSVQETISSGYSLGLKFTISESLTGLGYSNTSFTIPDIVTVSSSSSNLRLSYCIESINKPEYNSDSGRFTIRAFLGPSYNVTKYSDLCHVIEIEGNFDTEEFEVYKYKTSNPARSSYGFNNGPYEVIGDGNNSVTASSYYPRVIDIKNNKVIYTANSSGNYYLLGHGGCITLV